MSWGIRYHFNVLAACLLGLCVCLSVEAQAAKKNNIEAQRAWFKEARAAQNADENERYQALYKKLKGYPLAPYLDVWQAWKALKKGDDFSVEQALKLYPNIPESVDLRLAWIKSLAQRGQWPHVAMQLTLLKDAEARLPKEVLLSAWYNGDKAKAFDLLNANWRKGLVIDRYDVPFLVHEWKQAGNPSIAMTQARAVHLAKHGKWKAIHGLNQYLSRDDKHVLALWRKAKKHPLSVLKSVEQSMKKSTLSLALVEYALRQLSKSDTQVAWAQLQNMKAFLPEQRFGILQRNIALRSAKRHEVQSADWLAHLKEGLKNTETRAWHVRMLLLKQDWAAVVRAIESIPEAQQLQSRWMYWQAYALQQLNQKTAAALLFKQLSLGRGYYSFLSADRLGLPYNMGEKKLGVSAHSKLAKQAYMRRAYEWLQLDETGKASREWYVGLAGADAKTWLQALQVAVSWGWYDRAIQAASRAGAYDALGLRFPMAYAKDVQVLAEQTGLQRSLIWGVIRQESVFNAKAVSRTGARGLMQLMPRTAKHVAKKYRLGSFQPDELFSPSVNIRLGSLYLADLLKRFDGQKPLAIAAYNAGPTRVKQWQKRVPYEYSELWVELIPFNETRRYVQQVMAFTAVYDWRQNKPPVALLTQMNKKFVPTRASGS